MIKRANRVLSLCIGGQLVAVVALSLGASALFALANEAMAANGECVWEGGDGTPSYPYCEAEDCIGEGGLAQCSAGIAAPPSGVAESLLGGDKWRYAMCWNGPGTTARAASWCESGGGTWDPWAIECTDFQPGVLGITSTNSESLAVQISDAFIDDNFSPGSCGTTLASDSGWGQTVDSDFCWIGSPTDSLDILIHDFRELDYAQTGGGSCTSTPRITLRRDRTAVCPPGYKARTATSGQQCYIPAECSKTCVGNPVSVVTGTKFHREDDYLVGAETGIEFSRFYKSTGYYWPAQVYPLVAIPGGLKAEDVWRHSYDQRLSEVTGNSEVMAILQRADGSLQVFDTNGDEVTNRTSSGAEIEEVSGIGWDITQDDGTVERYNTDGKLLVITRQSGQVTTLTYASGRLSEITGPFGHALSLAYDGDGHLETLTLPDSGTINYSYDGLGRAISVTYDDDTTKEYLYEDSNNGFLLTGIIDETEVDFATYEYDSTGRVIEEEHAGGVTTFSFSYGALGQPTAVTDPLGTTTNFGFAVAAGMYRPATYSQPCMSCGSAASTTYDANGNPDIRTDYEGNQIKYTFDSSRNLETSRIEAYGTSLARTISTQWHTSFRLPTQISEPSRQTDLTYDSNGNLSTVTATDTGTSAYRIWTYTYNGVGQVLSVDGPLSGSTDTTTFTYYNCSGGSQCGQVASMTDAANNTTDFLTYNAHGLPLTVSDANGTVTTLTYDARQRVTSTSTGTETTTIAYWPTGLVKKETYPDGSFVEYGYDDAQRLIEISDTDGNRIAYTLDGAGNRVAETIYDSLDNVISSGTRVFDGFGRLDEAVGSDSQTASFTYDLNGNVLTEQDPYGRFTTYAYDALNRLATAEDWFDGISAFAYDDNDNLLAVTGPRSLVTSYAYNGFGDAISLTSPDTGASTTTRDAAGYIDVVTDSRSEAGDYSFDGLGRITSLVYGDQTIQYAYDGGTFGAGLLTGLTDGSGTTDWTYDAFGRVVLREQSTGTIDLDTAYSFNSYGQLSSLTTPSGQVIAYTYDSSGRVIGISVNSSTLISQIGYEPLGPTNGWTWGNSTTTTRTYDTDGQLVYLASAGESSTFTFYDDGRIATRTDSDPVSVAIPTGSTTFNTSGTSNRLTSTTGLVARTYSYDATGNTVSDGTASFGYDDSGRMVSATVGASTTTYDHNGLGERVKKSDGSTTAYFAYDEVGHLIGEYDANGDLIQETVWFGDIPVATLRPDGQSGVDVFYVHTDHLNTPRKVSRPSDDEILWRWDSDPFGQTPANEDPDNDTNAFSYNLRFPGQYLDEETGLHYNYFRDYDPVTGRYIESDPIGLDGGLNTYSYVGANPLRYSDATGLAVDVVADVGFVIYDLFRIGADNIFGDEGNFGENCVALVADTAAIFVPFATGAGIATRVGSAVTRSTSPIWKKLQPFRGQTRTNGLTGKKRRYYEWDNTHNDIEVYDRTGKHLGSADPTTGEIHKSAVPGRRIDI